MLLDKLKNVEARYLELEKSLSDPKIIADREKFQNYSKELGNLKELYDKTLTYKQVIREIADAKALSQEKDMAELAQAELQKLEPQKQQLEKEIEILLIP